MNTPTDEKAHRGGAAAGQGEALSRAMHQRDGDHISQGSRAAKMQGARIKVGFFQDRILYVAQCLRPELFVAWIRLVCHYVRLHGDVVDDDALLARFAGLGRKRWQELRQQLLDMGLAEVRSGKWIDQEQDRSIELQERASERSRRANLARWGRRGNGAA